MEGKYLVTSDKLMTPLKELAYESWDDVHMSWSSNKSKANKKGVVDGRGVARRSGREVAPLGACIMCSSFLRAGLLLLLLGVVLCAAGVPTPATSRRLDDDESRTFLRGWLLFDDPTSEGARRKGPTAKSVFIAPVVKDLPDCAQGYYADALGRCHKIVQINQAAQLGFLLQRLNAMYANNDKLIKRPSTTEGPVQVPIPLQLQVKPVAATQTTETPPVTEQVDMMVVAAEVQIKDERESISLPGAIVTLWHLNTTAAPEEQTSTLTEEEATTSTETSFSTDTTLMEDGTTLTTDTRLQDGTTLTTDTSGTTLITDTSGTTLTTLQVQDGTTTTSDQDSTLSEITSETTEIPTSETSTPMVTEESTTELPPTRATPTILSIQSPEETRGDSDLSSANSAEPPLTFELPGSEHHKWEEQPVRLPPKDELHVEEEQQGGWSWGPWNRPSSTPRPPLYLNFWSSQPHVPDPTIRTRTGLRRPPSRYPATFNGRPAPLYYQELTGQDVATVFRNQNAWYRGQRQ
ncbi:hypothetical protein B566_EDAN012089 [Ephemera danica]|nr:hypothetical protein B566_EDAN012089 [Ephemera danica]